MKIKGLKLPKKPATTWGLHVRELRGDAPRITPVEVIRYTDKTVVLWEGFSERKYARRSVSDGYYPEGHFEEAYAHAMRVTETYIKHAEAELKDAKELRGRLKAFKARGLTLIGVK